MLEKMIKILAAVAIVGLGLHYLLNKLNKDEEETQEAIFDGYEIVKPEDQ